MRSEYKKKRVKKVSIIVEKQLKRDIDETGKTISRTLDTWLYIINKALNSYQDNLRNTSEMACMFKKLKKHFIVIKEKREIPVGEDIYSKALKGKKYYKVELKDELANNI